MLETILVLFFLLVSGDTFLRRLVEVLPNFKNRRQAVDISQQIESDISAYLVTITLMNAGVGVDTDGGRIVNLSSGLARFSTPGFSAYAMTKGGIEVMTRYLAKELGARQIAVNTVAPGAIETDFGGGVVRDNKDMNKIIAGNTALGRAGLPEDIGPAVSALLSEDNRSVNAQRIEVSGGMFL